MRRPSPLLVAGIALALLPGLLMAYILWLAPAPDVADRAARAMRAFTNMWFAGRAALENPALLMDPEAYVAGLRGEFGAEFVRQVWGYPPSMLLVAAPFGALPLGLGFALWTTLGLAAFALALRSRRGPGIPAGVALAALFSPALLENALSGQTGALAGGLLLAGLLGAATHPRSSGLMLGALAVKPQMGLLIPIHLAASRRWSVIAWGAVSCIGMALASLAIWGAEPWLYFLGQTGGKMTGIMQRPFEGLPAQVNFTSPFMAAKAMGAGNSAAWAFQGIVSALCVAACVSVSSRLRHADGEDRLLCVAMVLGLDLLAVPYSHNYDLPVIAVAVALLWRRASMDGPLFPGEKALLAMAWAWPGVMVFLPIPFPELAFLSPVLGAAGIAAVAVLGWMRCRRIATPSPLPALPGDGRMGEGNERGGAG